MQVATLRAKYAALAPVFTERSRRVWAAAEAQAIGYGGIALVARATGMAESTIQRGLRDLQVRHPLPPARSRRAGGGRKRATVADPTLLRDLDALVEPTAPGDPESPLRWTSKSVRTLAMALEGLGHHVSHTVVAELLHALSYSLHWGDAQSIRTARPIGARSRSLSERCHRDGRADGHSVSGTPSLSRRLELHDSPCCGPDDIEYLFPDGS